MQLYFTDQEFDVVIGANPFDNIELVAKAVIKFIKDNDRKILTSDLATAGATIEISQHDDVICEYNRIDSNGSNPCVVERFTIKTTGDGLLNTDDNDKLHQQWLNAFEGYLHINSVELWNNKIGSSIPIGRVRILLLKILPGLGKSYLGKHHPNFVDYEDWVENRNLKYKERIGEDVINDVSTIVNEITASTPGEDIYISSSIAWEDFETDILKSVLYVSMSENEYNCEEVILRGRQDLCDKFGDRLIEWNNAYGKMKKQNKWEHVEYLLHSEELLNKNRIVEILQDIKGYNIP